MKMKIALCGCSGTGKTVVAKRLAEKLNITPVVGIVNSVLQQEGYIRSPDFHVEKFLATVNRQAMIFNKRKELESQFDDFVVDKSWIDQAAYSIIEMHANNSFDLNTFVDDCIEESKKYSAIFYIPWNSKPLKDNGVRTLDPWFQFTVDSVILNLLNKWELKYFTLKKDLTVNKMVDFICETI